MIARCTLCQKLPPFEAQVITTCGLCGAQILICGVHEGIDYFSKARRGKFCCKPMEPVSIIKT